MFAIPMIGIPYETLVLYDHWHAYIDLSRMLEQIGSGEFGQVYRAEWSVSGATKEIAIKILRAGSSEEEKVRFLQEAAIMGQFSHPCIVRLYGVVTVGQQVSY
jgi:serine/threonine protein kinase